MQKKVIYTMKNNEVQVVKSKFMSIVSSLQAIDAEKDNIKDLLKDLKDTHKITPKVSRQVAKLLHKGKDEDAIETAKAIEELYGELTQ